MATNVEPRSKRGQARYAERQLTPLEQIRVPGGSPGSELTGAYAYYLRPEGATIRDALILYPNGGIPDIADARRRARFGRNADYYRARQAAKGHEYLGQVLTEEAMAKVVATIQRNREDEILYVEDEIADCDNTAESADVPEIRQQAKKRKSQLQRRLQYLTEQLDPEEMATELNEIARAQKLANVDPAVLDVMRSMIGEVNANMAAAISKFQRTSKGDGNEDAPRGRGRPKKVASVDIDEGFENGVDHIEVD